MQLLSQAKKTLQFIYNHIFILKRKIVLELIMPSVIETVITK